MKTRIISAFPGTGKSHYAAANLNKVLDSDSSHFSWAMEEGKKSPKYLLPEQLSSAHHGQHWEI